MNARDKIRLTELAGCAGGASKMGPGALSDVLSSLRLPAHPDLLIGLDVSDDAAVYRLPDGSALVQTVDFFPPIVDDPYTFGAIAAANALSDVYAMGGRPILALAVAGFPEDLPSEVIRAILQGGADKVAEAGAVVAGGHTVVDKEPKYGLCVTGLVDPARVTPKANAQPGDVLLLTKALGTGLITTAAKQERASAEHLAAAVASMLMLNRRAAEIAARFVVHSATDITGFGLLGHAAEIARNSTVGLHIESRALPVLPGALEYAAAGIAPGGLHRNRAYLETNGYTRYAATFDQARKPLLFDPQTSGGLLIVLTPDEAARLEAAFAETDQACWRIGAVTQGAGIVVSGSAQSAEPRT
ncbi:selenide, water dikinase SelD [Candidatus Gracilibacteria bacterium]|nr:selenide, water dikinase SelD [Candidatus Gracilibacteria bacterium]